MLARRNKEENSEVTGLDLKGGHFPLNTTGYTYWAPQLFLEFDNPKQSLDTFMPFELRQNQKTILRWGFRTKQTWGWQDKALKPCQFRDESRFHRKKIINWKHTILSNVFYYESEISHKLYFCCLHFLVMLAFPLQSSVKLHFINMCASR